MKRKTAFTLAEVLITLGIIGVVAALTIPTLINDVQEKKIVEGRLSKFYSVMNNAIELSEVDNGASQKWNYPVESTELEPVIEFYNKYFANYLKTTGTKIENVQTYDNEGNPYANYDAFVVFFADGSAFTISSGGRDFTFYPYASKITLQQTSGSYTSKYKFAFCLNKEGSPSKSKGLIMPYDFEWDGTYDGLRNAVRYGCRQGSPTNNYCAKIIQLNGWKIPNNYPW